MGDADATPHLRQPRHRRAPTAGSAAAQVRRADQVCSRGCAFQCRSGLAECGRPDGMGGTMRYCRRHPERPRQLRRVRRASAPGLRLQRRPLPARCAELRHARADAAPTAASTAASPQSCANLQNDPANCGACGNAGLQRVCSAGRCATMRRRHHQLRGHLPRHPSEQRQLRACAATPAPVWPGVRHGRLRCSSLRRRPLQLHGRLPHLATDNQPTAGCAATPAPPARCARWARAGARRHHQLRGLCRDLQTDNGNCGMCARLPLVGQVCDGRVVSLRRGTTNCGGACRTSPPTGSTAGCAATPAPPGRSAPAAPAAPSPAAWASPTALRLPRHRLRQQPLRRLRHAPPASQICSRASAVSCGAGLSNCGGVCATPTPTGSTAACAAASAPPARSARWGCQVSCVSALPLRRRLPRPPDRPQPTAGVRDGRPNGLVCVGGACIVSCGRASPTATASAATRRPTAPTAAAAALRRQAGCLRARLRREAAGLSQLRRRLPRHADRPRPLRRLQQRLPHRPGVRHKTSAR